MRAFRPHSQLRLATALIVGTLLPLGAGAIDEPTSAAQITLSRGTAAPRPVRTLPQATVEISVAPFDAGQQLIASVATSPYLTSASLLPFQETSFDATTGRRFAPAEAAAGGRTVATGATPPEPGFWSAVASTLALALFFFVRRLG